MVDDTILQVGNFVTFSEALGSSPIEYIGIIISIKEIMCLSVAEVLWQDGIITTASSLSLKLL
jgi:hypothetical protein